MTQSGKNSDHVLYCGSFENGCVDPALLKGLMSVDGKSPLNTIQDKRMMVWDVCDDVYDSDHSTSANSLKTPNWSIAVTPEVREVQSSISHPSAPDQGLENDNLNKQTIYVTFNKIDHQSKKKKKAIEQWTSYKSKRPIGFDINLAKYNWNAFKLKMFEACETEKKGVASLLKVADAAGDLIFEGWINGSRLHMKNKHTKLKNKMSFGDYVEESLMVSTRYDMGDFDRTLQKKKACLGKDKQDDTNSSSSEDEDDESDGSVTLDPRKKKTKILRNRFKNQWEAGESVVQLVNPKDPGEILLLNSTRIRLWASDWKWIPAALVPEEKVRLMGNAPPKTIPTTPDTAPPTIIHNNYYTIPLGNLPGHLNFPQTPTRPLPLPVSGELSPPPGPTASIEEFVMFTKIDRSKIRQTVDIFSDAGVDGFQELLDRWAYSLDNLQDKVKLPYGHALIIYKAVPEFKEHLRRRFTNNHE
ncbi:hypothetical protein DFH28DRAFT_1119136 [Melampsora americana]|nr:hypothetical protein DFH28DRAFT_1119136 [Melampsora americana]